MLDTTSPFGSLFHSGRASQDNAYFIIDIKGDVKDIASFFRKHSIEKR